MFSNDQNVETIAQLIEVIKHYIGLQSEYVKLDVIDKVVRLLTMLVLIAVFGILLVIAIIYFSFAAAYALSDAIGSLPGAFAIVKTKAPTTTRSQNCAKGRRSCWRTSPRTTNA